MLRSNDKPGKKFHNFFDRKFKRDIQLVKKMFLDDMEYDSSDISCQNCPVQDAPFNAGLCGQCILYVGGRSKITPHLRQLVEQREGTFLHHDGGLEQNIQALYTLIKQADIVVFPTNCVSHKAYWQIKKCCKKQNKPMKTLNSTGVSTLSIMLDELAG
jgi:hypothetical protein